MTYHTAELPRTFADRARRRRKGRYAGDPKGVRLGWAAAHHLQAPSQWR